MSSPLELMVQRYSSALIDALAEAKKKAASTDDPFEVGRAGGFYMALTMLFIRARAAGIDLETLGLKDIDPDDLL